jgi:hypothetical protein
VEEASSAYGAEMWHELYVMVGAAAVLIEILR